MGKSSRPVTAWGKRCRVRLAIWEFRSSDLHRFSQGPLVPSRSLTIPDPVPLSVHVYTLFLKTLFTCTVHLFSVLTLISFGPVYLIFVGCQWTLCIVYRLFLNTADATAQPK